MRKSEIGMNDSLRCMERSDPEASVTKVFTIGYEGRSLDGLIRELTTRGIEQLIDVRQRASSRKPGFSKTALRSGLEEAGISYHHMPELGSPGDVRRALREGGSVTAFMREYGAYLDTREEAYGMLRELVLRRPSAMMCFERDRAQCHRSILADRLAAEGFLTVHI